MSRGFTVCWKPADKPENRIFVAATSTVVVGGAQSFLNSFDVFGSKAMVEFAAYLVCMWFFPTEQRAVWSVRLILALIAIGIIGGILWVAVVGYPQRNELHFLTWDQVPISYYLLGLVTGCVVSPLFEEKIVRNLLLSGASQYLGKFLASLAVSALFAWVHTDGMVFAFVASIALCAGFYVFKLDTVQRSVIHGFVNFVITHWVLIYPHL